MVSYSLPGSRAVAGQGTGGVGEKLVKGGVWGRALGLYQGGFWVLYHTIFLPLFTLSHLLLLHSYHYLYLIHYHCFLLLLHFVFYLIINIATSSVSPNHFYLSSFPPFFIIIINHPLIRSKIHNIISFVFWDITTSHALPKIYNKLIL